MPRTRRWCGSWRRAKLEAEGEKVRAAEGWAFVMHELQENTDAYSYRREQPTRREATKEEADRRAAIEQELTALEDEGWDDQTAEGRAVAQHWNRLEAEHEALEACRESWTPEQKQRCGVWLGITTYGKIEQRRGFVDPARDKKQREEVEAKRAEQEKPAHARLEGAGPDGTGSAEPRRREGRGGAVEMPRTLVWKLTKARTEALRASMIQNPDAVADLLIAHLCERFFFSTQFASRSHHDPLPFEVQHRRRPRRLLRRHRQERPGPRQPRHRPAERGADRVLRRLAGMAVPPAADAGRTADLLGGTRPRTTRRACSRCCRRRASTP